MEPASLGENDDLLYEQRVFSEGKKLHYKTSFQNLPISIENRKGSVRKGKDSDGDEWKTKMKIPYGYIPGTKGVDGEALDVFVGPNEDAAYVFVVHLLCPETGKYDEDKLMLGFDSKGKAKQVFYQHYDDPAMFGGIDKIPMWKFHDKVWTKKETSKRLVASFREARFPSSATNKNMAKSLMGNHREQIVEPNAREHGTKGQQWGVKKQDAPPNTAKKMPEQKPQEQKKVATKPQDLAHDPRTLSMMQNVVGAQVVLNNKAKQQRADADPRGAHAEAVKALANKGFRPIGTGIVTKDAQGGKMFSTAVRNQEGHTINVYTTQQAGKGFTHYVGNKGGQPIYPKAAMIVRREKQRQKEQSFISGIAQKLGGKPSLKRRESY